MKIKLTLLNAYKWLLSWRKEFWDAEDYLLVFSESKGRWSATAYLNDQIYGCGETKEMAIEDLRENLFTAQAANETVLRPGRKDPTPVNLRDPRYVEICLRAHFVDVFDVPNYTFENSEISIEAMAGQRGLDIGQVMASFDSVKNFGLAQSIPPPDGGNFGAILKHYERYLESS